MDGVFYTLQDFFAHTKGVIYVLTILSLGALGAFWSFLTGRDED